MTHIVYLIKHLDTDMKYVGITSADLKTRWDQHRNDPNSAVYEALRADGHRMTMEVLEQCDTREQALRREQEYIRDLGTAAPRGWNRMVKNMQRKKYTLNSKAARINDWCLCCPVCGCGNVHFNYDDRLYAHAHYRHLEREMRIEISCEECHHDDNDYSPPPYALIISDDNGSIHLFVEYWVEVRS